MRICKIYDDDYPWDVRVEKIGRSLVEGGHQVFLAARNRKRQEVYDYVDTMDVWRMPPIRRLPGAIDRQLMFPAFFSPRWISHIKQVATRNRCDVLMVRDLPLALSAVAVGKSLRKPVVLDMAENYPAALRAIHTHKKPTIVDHLARNPVFAQLVEDSSLPLLDHILVVCDENRERLIRRGVSPHKVTVVGNTPNLELFRGDPPPQEIIDRFDGDFVLVYVGSVDPFRGLDTIVEALPAIRKKIPNVRLAILGKGGGVPEVEALARQHGVADHVDMVGFRPLAELPGYIARGDVCIIPHHRNEHIDTTLPNKLFDYMALGRPVLATDAVPLERIIEEVGSGLVYRSGDAASVAEKVLLLADEETRRKMGQAGVDAVREKYNWAVDTKILLEVFDELEARG